MAHLSPRGLLKTKQVYSFERIKAMLEQPCYGFIVEKKQGTSHAFVYHPDYKDLQFGIVCGTNIPTYQVFAAKACLEIEKRQKQPNPEYFLPEEDKNEISAQTTVDDAERVFSKGENALQEFPKDMRITRQKNQILLRHNEWPEIGTIIGVDEHSDIYTEVERQAPDLRKRAEDLHQTIEIAKELGDFELKRDEKGQLAFRHPYSFGEWQSVPVYTPFSQEDPLNIIEQEIDTITEMDATYDEIMKIIKHFSGYKGEEFSQPDKTGARSLTVHFENVLTEKKDSLQLHLSPNGRVPSKEYMEFQDRLLSLYYEPNLVGRLERNFGIKVKMQTNGQILLRQPILETQFHMQNPFSGKTPQSIFEHCLENLSEETTSSQKDVQKAFSEYTDLAHDLLSNWHNIVKMAVQTYKYAHEVSTPQRYRKLTHDLDAAGYKWEQKTKKPGRADDIHLRDPTGENHLKIKLQPLVDLKGKAFIIMNKEDLHKVEATLQKKQAKHLPPPLMPGFQPSNPQTSSTSFKAAIRSACGIYDIGGPGYFRPVIDPPDNSRN